VTTKYTAIVAKPRQQKIKAKIDQPSSTKVRVNNVVKAEAQIDVYDGGEF
jgi:hypothetical protein